MLKLVLSVLYSHVSSNVLVPLWNLFQAWWSPDWRYASGLPCALLWIILSTSSIYINNGLVTIIGISLMAGLLLYIYCYRFWYTVHYLALLYFTLFCTLELFIFWMFFRDYYCGLYLFSYFHLLYALYCKPEIVIHLTILIYFVSC